MRNAVLAPLLLLLHAAGSAFGQDVGWVSLFDGETIEGWTPRVEVVSFEAADGELQLLSEKNVWVTTDLQLDDFEVEMEVMLPEDAREVGFNSGLAFRCQGEGKPKGYQFEVDLAKPGAVYGIGIGGWLYPKGKAAEEAYAGRLAEADWHEDDWNHVRVVAEGPRIRTYANGALLSDFEDDTQLGGYFAIQHHGKGGTVRFRNLRARALGVGAVGAATRPEGERPNILWISAEDMSPTLGCYGDTYAHTPHLDALAEESVVYDLAFAAAPVCAPSRSCLITGIHPATTGTGHMRSTFPLPEGVKGFPTYLREAGYFTTNNVKTDYNNGDAARLIEESWHESSDTAGWRHDDREDGQNFFAVFNLMESHQSRTMVWPYPAFQEHIQSQLDPAHVHDPEAAPVPPYYPDTPVVRREIARFYDCVSVMDQKVGDLLGQLEEDGLADDTIVVFFSDHGNGMPRHKRLLHDSGMKVALMVRFPEKFQHLAPSAPGSRDGRLVSFVDFPPTMLRTAGLTPPEYMGGAPFFGLGSEDEREVVYGSRDRVDEVFDAARSVRTEKWLYIRNYAPHLSYHQPTVFPDLGDIRGEFPEAADGNSALQHYVSPTRPAEELYDCEADPDNLHNLVEEPGADAALDAMRALYAAQREAHRDPVGIPEGEMWNLIRDEEAALGDILAGGAAHSPDLAATWAAADRVGTADEDELVEALGSTSPSDRYWAIIGLRHLDPNAGSVPPQVIDHLLDTSPDVRIETADFLCQSEMSRPEALGFLVSDLEHEDWWVALEACRAIELLGAKAAAALPAMKATYERCRNAPGDRHFFLAFSSGAFLDAMGEETEPWDFTPGAASMFADPDEEEE